MAEQIIGPSWTSYEQTVQHILQMEDMITVLSPQDRPLIGGIGGNDVPLLPSKPVLNRIFYWQEEDEPQPYSVTAASVANDTVTSITITTGEGANFRIGDFIRIEDEVVKVTAIDSSGPDVLQVERGAAGTTAAAHTTVGTPLQGLGTVLPEGQLGGASYLGRDSYNNYTQIFSGTVEVTETEQIIPKYGVPNELAKQSMIQLKRIHLEMENSAVNGIKWQDSTTRRRMSGGFKSWVTTAANVDSSSTFATLGTLEALQAVVHGNGGETDGMVFMANEANFSALNNLTDTGRIRVQDIGDSRRGRSQARILMTEYGDVTLARNRRLLSTDGLLYHPSRFVKRDMRPLVMFPLAKTADTTKYGIVGECGWQVKGADQAARFSALDATDTFPTSGLV